MRLCYGYIFRGQMSKPPCSVMVRWKVISRQGRTDLWASHEDFKQFKNRYKSLENRSLLASLLRSVNTMPCGKKILMMMVLVISSPEFPTYKYGCLYNYISRDWVFRISPKCSKILYFCKENCSFKEPGHIPVSMFANVPHRDLVRINKLGQRLTQKGIQHGSQPIYFYSYNHG